MWAFLVFLCLFDAAGGVLTTMGETFVVEALCVCLGVEMKILGAWKLSSN